MGGSKSKSVQKVFNEVINDVVSRNTQRCGTNIEQDIEFGDISGSGNTFGIDQNAMMDVTCLQDTELLTQLTNDMKTDLAQLIETQSEALFGVLGKSESDTTQDIKNKVLNKITVENIQESVQSTIQKFKAGNVSGDNNTINISQSAETIAKNMTENLLKSEIESIQEVVSKQDVKTTQKGPFAVLESALDAFAKFLALPGYMMMMPVAFCLCCCVIIMVIMLLPDSGTSGTDLGAYDQGYPSTSGAYDQGNMGYDVSNSYNDPGMYNYY